VTKEKAIDVLKLYTAEVLKMVNNPEVTLEAMHQEIADAIEVLATAIAEDMRPIDAAASDN